MPRQTIVSGHGAITPQHEVSPLLLVFSVSFAPRMRVLSGTKDLVRGGATRYDILEVSELGAV